MRPFLFVIITGVLIIVDFITYCRSCDPVRVDGLFCVFWHNSNMKFDYKGLYMNFILKSVCIGFLGCSIVRTCAMAIQSHNGPNNKVQFSESGLQSLYQSFDFLKKQSPLVAYMNLSNEHAYTQKCYCHAVVRELVDRYCAHIYYEKKHTIRTKQQGIMNLLVHTEDLQAIVPREQQQRLRLEIQEIIANYQHNDPCFFVLLYHWASKDSRLTIDIKKLVDETIEHSAPYLLKGDSLFSSCQIS